MLSLASMDKIFKKAGAIRVSDDAKAALRSIVEERAEDIAKQAIVFAKHAGRRTVKAQDVNLAIKGV